MSERVSLKEHIINKKNNFIAGWYLPNKDLCKNLINFFEKSNNKSEGRVGNDKIDKLRKDSTDVSLNISLQEPLTKEYIKNLSLVLEKYKEMYKYVDHPHDSWGITENFNIQRYLPNQGFHAYHTERSGLIDSLRHLAFMTFLNDVNDGGETEWYYQKLKIKPETGLTLIWGTDWTFTHRGIPSKTEKKYIVTGWYSYIK
jgi:hypothetical protein